MYSATNIAFVVCAGLGVLLVLVPLPKAIASGNFGTSILITWTELACLAQFVNAIRWNKNIENWAPAWCDFCNYFLIATDVALVACAVSINRRLYMIVTLDPKGRERTFNTMVDIALCLVIPCASTALEYVVQQYRFFIYEDLGCLPGVLTVDLAFPLVWMLPLFTGVIAAGYACLTMRSLKDTGVGPLWSWRLIVIGAVTTLYGLIPTSVVIILLATTNTVTPWPGWGAVHSTIGDIVYVPALEWQSSTARIASIELRRWTTVSLAYIIFILLGLTTDVKEMYWAPFRGVIDSINRARVTYRQSAHGISDVQRDSVSSHCSRNYLLPFATPRGGSGREGLHPISRSKLNSGLESFQLVYHGDNLNSSAVGATLCKKRSDCI